MNIKRCLWLIFGCVAFTLGAVGSVIPMLPTMPFLVLAMVGFANSSERVHRWFVGTTLYKNNLASYVAGEGMSSQAKRRIIITVTALMSVGFMLMLAKALYIPCAILVGVWIIHLLYFKFGIKTYQSI